MTDGGSIPLIEAENVTRILPGEVPVTLVRDIDLTFSDGELVAITGPSGSGKSSLLYVLGLLDTPTEGRVLFNGEDTALLDAEARARLRLEFLGFVFQFHFLLAEFTILENTMIPMRRLGYLSDSEIHDRGIELLTSLGLGDHIDKRPDQLSGGERQRGALARSLANNPPVILADEPTGNLDTRNSEIVFDILASLVRDQKKTVIMVTHDIGLAERTGRRIHLVDARVVRDEKAATAAADTPVG